ncbi:hypothetical protein V3C33_14130 [Micrococcaceae bacterium Sec5.7]
MKKWYLLSIPLIGLSSISVWVEANAGPPAIKQPGVVAEFPSGQGTGLDMDGSASWRVAGPTAPATRPPSPSASATPAKNTSPSGDDDNSGDVKLVHEDLVTSPPAAPAAQNDDGTDDRGRGSGSGSGSSGSGSSGSSSGSSGSSGSGGSGSGGSGSGGSSGSSGSGSGSSSSSSSSSSKD